MTLGEKIYRLRTEKGLSQEAFGEVLNVSRQSVSKWETDQSVPELDKLVAISDFFEVSIDYMLKDEVKENKSDTGDSESAYYIVYQYKRPHREYKSKKMIGSLPLVHVNVGVGLYRAKGVIAIGNIAQGCIAIGFLAMGGIGYRHCFCGTACFGMSCHRCFGIWFGCCGSDQLWSFFHWYFFYRCAVCRAVCIWRQCKRSAGSDWGCSER